MLSNRNLNRLFNKNINLNFMNTTSKKLATPLLDELAQTNKQKEMEYSEYMKAILFQYREDCLNDNLPHIVATPECEKIYCWAAIVGAKIGIESATNIHNEIFESPTINRYQQGTFTDSEATELIN